MVLTDHPDDGCVGWVDAGTEIVSVSVVVIDSVSCLNRYSRSEASNRISGLLARNGKAGIDARR